MESFDFDWKRIIFTYNSTIRSWILSTPNQEQSIHRRVIQRYTLVLKLHSKVKFSSLAAAAMLPDLLNLLTYAFFILLQNILSHVAIQKKKL